MLRNTFFASARLRQPLTAVLAQSCPRNSSTTPTMLPLDQLLGQQKEVLVRLQATCAKNTDPDKKVMLDKTLQMNAGTEKEVRHHENQASDWWNQNGSMGALHALNEIRVPFIRDGIVSRGTVEPGYVNTTKVLKGQRILEVGCGGGLLTEQLARLGAHVTGIDLGEKLIEAACDHLNSCSPELASNVVYKIEPVDQHAKGNCEIYDSVVVSEVLEHVDDKVGLLEASVRTLKPGGSIFITTLNKTIPSWFGGVILSEYVLNLVPKGTHHWEKMISPLDVQRILDTMNCQTVLVNGSTYDFWSNTWRWINNTQMCYALQAVKNKNP